MISARDVEQAVHRIRGKVHRTPTHFSTTLSERTGFNLGFKMEMFQKTGSFKVRGVLNKLSQLTPEEKEKGVVSMSSGNHAQALAYGAKAEGIEATIVMPEWSRESKIEATRGYGGNVVLTAGDLMEGVRELQEEKGLAFVHPFDDPLVIAGQGTLGLEMLEDIPQPDAVFVTIGGGGLISGIATAIKERSPQTRIIGIEPEGAPAMARSLEEGKPVKLDEVDTIADGLAAPFAGKHTFEVVKKHVDRVLLVSDKEVVDAMRLILERCKALVEPSAAAAMVPLLDNRIDLPAGSTAVCVLCGGNVDAEALAELFGT